MTACRSYYEKEWEGKWLDPHIEVQETDKFLIPYSESRYGNLSHIDFRLTAKNDTAEVLKPV